MENRGDPRCEPVHNLVASPFAFRSHGACRSLTEIATTMLPRLRGGVRKTLRAGARLYEQGAATDHVYLVIRGALRTEAFASDGSPTTSDSHGPDDLVGELCFCQVRERQERATAVVASEVVVVRVDDLLSLASRDRDALVGLVEELCHRVDDARRRLHQLAFDSGERRVVARIVALARAEGTLVQPGLVAVVRRPSQAAIAAAAFVSREFVNRVLGDLRTRGFISFDRSGPMMVYLARLERAAARSSVT